MIVVTGGEGFIGKNIINQLVKQHVAKPVDIVILDTKYQSLDSIYIWLTEHVGEIEYIIHMGAITDTTETNNDLLFEHNTGASMFIWNLCTEHSIPLIYASSAATYGNGINGFDDEKDISFLQPLNAYGWSKQNFDLWCQMEDKTPPHWYGLKFFNVYGQYESHKGSMASVVLHAYNQIKTTGKIKLFKSYLKDCEDGEQCRDFIYVDDVVNTIIYLMEHPPKSGLYNVGTGKARSFNDLAKAVFKSLRINEKITYIDMPTKIIQSYQYFTMAKMNKLRSVGCDFKFYELEDGVDEYIKKLEYENC